MYSHPLSLQFLSLLKNDLDQPAQNPGRKSHQNQRGMSWPFQPFAAQEEKRCFRTPACNKSLQKKESQLFWLPACETRNRSPSGLDVFLDSRFLSSQRSLQKNTPPLLLDFIRVRANPFWLLLNDLYFDMFFDPELPCHVHIIHKNIDPLPFDR